MDRHMGRHMVRARSRDRQRRVRKVFRMLNTPFSAQGLEMVRRERAGARSRWENQGVVAGITGEIATRSPPQVISIYTPLIEPITPVAVVSSFRVQISWLVVGTRS